MEEIEKDLKKGYAFIKAQGRVLRKRSISGCGHLSEKEVLNKTVKMI